ncbi:MAG: DUF3180 domain-containing protein [Nocardiopsaceae bacterium]|nr:DUF3180 domain-containing protein [Nocardiopsaceae bacterium]
MRPTRPLALLLIGVVCAVIAWAVLKGVYADLPPLSWTGVPALLIAAAIEAWSGRDLKARISGREGYKPAPPLFVARLVVLAKASAYAAAVLAGASLGFVVFLLRLLQDPTPRADMLTAGVTFGSSLALLAAALYLEHSCRVPKDPDRDDEPAPPPPSSPFPSH